MIWVQSILFFIFGSAVTGFLVMLVFPLVWRRALFLANKAVRMEVPVSLNEVEVERDFLRAEHATTVARLEELLKISENRYAEALLHASKMRERNYYLASFEQQTQELIDSNKQLSHEIVTLKQELNVAKSALLEQKALTIGSTMAESNDNETSATVENFNKNLSTDNQQDFKKLNLRGEGDMQSLTALTDQEISHFYEENKKLLVAKEQTLNVLREQIKTMAAILVANVAANEGADSPIFGLISKDENANSLARLIKRNSANVSNKTA
ncbi:hypothetical protein [Bartonella sp. HY038]|uniref:hypothetical protein n=1 Tax=Bartonella sp. HY038 TaxID=2759660 RepID=UPI0015F92B03|nr:hypothetical protein [Bartonella sp. HY038]